jgi:hypothetical protein
MILLFNISFALIFFRLWWDWMIFDLVGTMGKSNFWETILNWKGDFCNFECAISKVLPVTQNTRSSPQCKLVCGNLCLSIPFFASRWIVSSRQGFNTDDDIYFDAITKYLLWFQMWQLYIFKFLIAPTLKFQGSCV